MPKPTSLFRKLYVACGIFFVGCGVAGAILPLVPTTPFLLLALFFFSKSSDRLHAWLLNHPWLGPYIHAFRSRRGLTVAQKLRIGLSMTIAMAISFLVVNHVIARVFLASGWAFWMSILILSRTAVSTVGLQLEDETQQAIPVTNPSDPLQTR